MPDLTIFSAPKPFTNPHIALIQRNAIRSWVSLGPRVEIILLGDEPGIALAAEEAAAAAECGVRHIPDVPRSASGTPLVSGMFDLARQNSTSPLLCCVNADILFMPDVVQGALDALHCVAARGQAAQFLIVGQRWDLEVRSDPKGSPDPADPQPLDFSAGWPERLKQRAQTQGKLHRASGSDYFIFPRDCFRDMPAFAIGRAGWDNWMIYAGRRNGWPVIDATPSIMIIHQNHDYSHLPGGQPHYHHPETFENVRLAGGKRVIFELHDANRRLIEGQLRPIPRSWRKFWREVEIFPLVTLHSYPLGQLFYAIFHPVKAYWEFRGARNG